MNFVRMYAFAAAATLALLVAQSGSTAAQGVDAFDAIFKEWMAKHSIRWGALAVANQNKLAFNRGYVKPASTSHLLASLSKAITGVCAATLVDAGKLSFDTRVGEALAEHFRKYGEPADLRAKDATIGQLLAHRSGYARTASANSSATKDPATGTTLSDFLRDNPVDYPQIGDLLRRAFRINMTSLPGERYAYTNMSFLMLGAAIEQASGRTYEDYCRDAVLKPLGVNASLHKTWKVLSSFGGWQMTGPQYLRFLEAFAPNSKVLGPKGRAFLTEPENKWVSAKRDVHYALGVNVRPVQGGGYHVWHGGEWRYEVRNGRSGSLSENLGTYAVRYNRGVSWFAQFEPEPPDGAKSELDRLLGRATAAVKQWPEEDLYVTLERG